MRAGRGLDRAVGDHDGLVAVAREARRVDLELDDDRAARRARAHVADDVDARAADVDAQLPARRRDLRDDGHAAAGVRHDGRRHGEHAGPHRARRAAPGLRRSLLRLLLRLALAAARQHRGLERVDRAARVAVGRDGDGARDVAPVVDAAAADVRRERREVRREGVVGDVGHGEELGAAQRRREPPLLRVRLVAAQARRRDDGTLGALDELAERESELPVLGERRRVDVVDEDERPRPPEPPAARRLVVELLEVLGVRQRVDE